MIRIDEKSIKDLLKVRAGTKYAFAKIPDGLLFHSQWFSFLLPADSVVPAGTWDPHPQAAEWRRAVCPEGASFTKAMPMLSKDPGEPEEPLVHFRTPDPKIVSYMKAPVYDWLQGVFDAPEFWVQGVDQIVAIKQSGTLIGGVGPCRLRVASPAAL